MPISDNFESLADGQPLSADANWDVWQVSGSGVPTMDQHDDHSDGSQVVDVSAVGDSYSLYQTQVGGDDHTCELDVFVDVDPANANAAGPIARATASAFGAGTTNGYAAWAYALALGGGQSSFQVGIVRLDNDVPTELANTGNIQATYDAGIMHTLRLEVDGSTLTAFVDDDEVLSTTDATYAAGQFCGFRLFRQRSSTFSQPFVDNFAGDVLAGGPVEIAPAATVISPVEGTLTVTAEADIAPTGAVIQTAEGTLDVSTTVEITPAAAVIQTVEGTADVTAEADITPVAAVIATTEGTLTVTAADAESINITLDVLAPVFAHNVDNATFADRTAQAAIQTRHAAIELAHDDPGAPTF